MYRGMTFIDVIVGTALMLIIFLGILGIVRTSAVLATYIKAQATATTIANSQLEYIRSLSYDNVGTVGGIPSGTIAQNATTTEGGISYGVRTFIDYYDDPSDGTGSSDTNGITTDYKRIKITVSYTVNTLVHTISLVSNYSPDNLETTTGGGTLQIFVVNATGSAVSGATVHIVNASTSPTVDLTTFSDSSGTVYLPGAATSTQYQVSVTKSGYSTAQTYKRDTTNQNPTPGYLTVVKNQTTSSTFAIDQLGTLAINTFTPIATTTFSDAFANTSKISSFSNTNVISSALTLTGSSGSYAASGTATSITYTPTYLNSWGVLMATTTKPTNTTIALHVLDSTGALIPDAVLAGNSTGFTSFPVNLTGISTTTYPALAIKGDLSTSDSTVRPTITGWSINASAGPVPVPNVAFTLTGAKTIGSTGSGSAIYKTTVSATTDSTGSNTQTLEWDSYKLALTSYDTIDACNAPPFSLSPGGSVSQSLFLGASTTNAILITVTDSSGIIVPGASVTLSRTGFSKTVTTSSCGTAYFGGLTAATDYKIGLSKTGYTTSTVTNVSVSGHVFYTASF